MRVLVTGGCGFVGSHYVVELLRQGHDVHIVDDLSNSSASVVSRIQEIVGRRPTFSEMSILDVARITNEFRAFEPDVIVHFAAFKHVPESALRPREYYQNNVGGLMALLAACSDLGPRRLVFSSSASVYGETDSLPINEDHAHVPTNPYSASKSICERILADLAQSDEDWSICALRYFNPAGAHPSGLLGEQPQGRWLNLLPRLLDEAQSQRPTAVVHGDDFATSDGSGVRDYVHVMDVATAHVRALDWTGRERGFLALNVGRGVGVSVFEMIESVERATGCKFRVVVEPRRTGDVSALYGDSGRFATYMGDIDYRTIEQICEDAWRWRQKAEGAFSAPDADRSVHV